MCVCARERGLNVCARYVSSSRDVRCLYANRKLTISSTRAADRPTTFLLFPSLFPFFPLFFFTKTLFTVCHKMTAVATERPYVIATRLIWIGRYTFALLTFPLDSPTHPLRMYTGR